MLDTHVLLQWSLGGINDTHAMVVAAASESDPLLVSDVSLWETATLCSLGRIRLDRPLLEWLRDAVAPPLVELVRITPAIAAEVANLPNDFHRDPADRILVATARVRGATMLTTDYRIINARLCDTL